jgi:hypothetical protein
MRLPGVPDSARFTADEPYYLERREREDEIQRRLRAIEENSRRALHERIRARPKFHPPTSVSTSSPTITASSGCAPSASSADAKALSSPRGGRGLDG